MLETAAVLCEQSSKKYNLVNHIRFLLYIPIFQVPRTERQVKIKIKVMAEVIYILFVTMASNKDTEFCFLLFINFLFFCKKLGTKNKKLKF